MSSSTTAFPSAPLSTTDVRGSDVGGMQLPGRSSWAGPYGSASPGAGSRRSRYPHIKDLQDQAARLEVDERSPVILLSCTGCLLISVLIWYADQRSSHDCFRSPAEMPDAPQSGRPWNGLRTVPSSIRDYRKHYSPTCRLSATARPASRMVSPLFKSHGSKSYF